MFFDWKGYLAVIFIPIIAVMPDYFWNSFWWLIKPTECQKLLNKNKAVSNKVKVQENREDS